MSAAAHAVVLLIALLHAYILVLEMFLWDKPSGRQPVGLTPEQAAQTKVLDANQGLYNGFLAAGPFWGLWLGAEDSPFKGPFFPLISNVPQHAP